MKQLATLISFSVLFMISGCSFVKTTDEGELVRLVSSRQAASCKKVGKTTVSVLGRIGFVERNRETMADELVVLARNSAASTGGDAIVKTGSISASEHSFDVYKCR